MKEKASYNCMYLECPCFPLDTCVCVCVCVCVKPSRSKTWELRIGNLYFSVLFHFISLNRCYFYEFL